MIYIVLALAAVALVLAALPVLRPQLQPAPSIKTMTVAVSTRDERTVKGIVVAQHADVWILNDAVEIHAGGDQPLGGTIRIPVDNISFAQVIG